ncbi:hypothetical protein DBV33_17960 [Pseudomonas fluorescens]|nr:hypothetical protein DBV33_17960 [Pseudomonas fluorescens]
MILSVGHGIGGLATTGLVGATGGLLTGETGLAGEAGFTGGLTGGTAGLTGGTPGFTGGFTGCTGGLTGGTDGLLAGLGGCVTAGRGFGLGTGALAIAFLTIQPCLLLRRTLKAIAKSFFQYSILERRYWFIYRAEL